MNRFLLALIASAALVASSVSAVANASSTGTNATPTMTGSQVAVQTRQALGRRLTFIGHTGTKITAVRCQTEGYARWFCVVKESKPDPDAAFQEDLTPLINAAKQQLAVAVQKNDVDAQIALRSQLGQLEDRQDDERLATRPTVTDLYYNVSVQGKNLIWNLTSG